jgi:hypothetical protein
MSSHPKAAYEVHVPTVDFDCMFTPIVMRYSRDDTIRGGMFKLIHIAIAQKGDAVSYDVVNAM